MFLTDLRSLRSDLQTACRGLDPDALSPAEAAVVIEELAGIGRLVEGTTVRLARRIDDTVAGAEGDSGPVRWLARRTGTTMHAAGETIAASEATVDLPATDAALADGELNATKAHEVTSAAALDPAAEADLLQLARDGSLSELRRAAKKVRAAAKDHDVKARDAHEHRDLSSSTDEETGEGELKATGPAAAIARMLALLEPWIQAQFDKARTDGCRERRGALAFDALLAALGFADAARHGTQLNGLDDDLVPTGPPARILARIDAVALRRGHTLAGETCEIDGLGPVPVDALRDLLPQAAIDLIVTNGTDAFNVTHLGRRANARQQVVLDWIGGQCSRLGCPAARHLQVDHRIDWAKVHLTELKALDWLCPTCHRRKTHHHWALVHGRGKRRMVPPDHPDHPANAPPEPAGAAPRAGPARPTTDRRAHAA